MLQKWRKEQNKLDEKRQEQRQEKKEINAKKGLALQAAGEGTKRTRMSVAMAMAYVYASPAFHAEYDACYSKRRWQRDACGEWQKDESEWHGQRGPRDTDVEWQPEASALSHEGMAAVQLPEKQASGGKCQSAPQKLTAMFRKDLVEMHLQLREFHKTTQVESIGMMPQLIRICSVREGEPKVRIICTTGRESGPDPPNTTCEEVRNAAEEARNAASEVNKDDPELSNDNSQTDQNAVNENFKDQKSRTQRPIAVSSMNPNQSAEKRTQRNWRGERFHHRERRQHHRGKCPSNSPRGMCQRKLPRKKEPKEQNHFQAKECRMSNEQLPVEKNSLEEALLCSYRSCQRRSCLPWLHWERYLDQDSFCRFTMAATLVDEMSELTIKEPQALETQAVQFKLPGLQAFDLELGLATAVRDVKKMAKEYCNIEPEHMRLIYNGHQLKDWDTLECYDAKADSAVQILFTAGHVAMLGGVGGTGGGPRGGHGAQPQRNPFSAPVRGLPGSKGLRSSRVSGRPGGMALIRKYGIMMKRQEFREKAEEIGFVKYR
eukprot:s3349_g7.t1